MSNFLLIDLNMYTFFRRFLFTSIAIPYLSFNLAPILEKSGSARQHVFIEQEPDTPWHLQAVVKLFSTICK